MELFVLQLQFHGIKLLIGEMQLTELLTRFKANCIKLISKSYQCI